MTFNKRFHARLGVGAAFLFQAGQLDMPVGSLSGGEQARVLIARLMLRPADLLILDEPTNDLDIPTLEVLEQSLLEFPGALILVTHDRYLLDRISTTLLAHWTAKAEEPLSTPIIRSGKRSKWPCLNPLRQSNAKPFPPPPPQNRPSAPDAAFPLSNSANCKTWKRPLWRRKNRLAALQTEDAATGNRRRLSQTQRPSWTPFAEAERKVVALYARWEELEARK